MTGGSVSWTRSSACAPDCVVLDLMELDDRAELDPMELDDCAELDDCWLAIVLVDITFWVCVWPWS
jgi:hypothetical protein